MVFSLNCPFPIFLLWNKLCHISCSLILLWYCFYIVLNLYFNAVQVCNIFFCIVYVGLQIFVSFNPFSFFMYKSSSTYYYCIDFTVMFWLVHSLISWPFICTNFKVQYHVHPYGKKCEHMTTASLTVFQWTWNFNLYRSLLASWIILMLFSNLRSNWWHKLF